MSWHDRIQPPALRDSTAENDVCHKIVPGRFHPRVRRRLRPQQAPEVEAARTRGAGFAPGSPTRLNAGCGRITRRHGRPSFKGPEGVSQRTQKRRHGNRVGGRGRYCPSRRPRVAAPASHLTRAEAGAARKCSRYERGQCSGARRSPSRGPRRCTAEERAARDWRRPRRSNSRYVRNPT